MADPYDPMPADDFQAPVVPEPSPLIASVGHRASSSRSRSSSGSRSRSRNESLRKVACPLTKHIDPENRHNGSPNKMHNSPAIHCPPLSHPSPPSVMYNNSLNRRLMKRQGQSADDSCLSTSWCLKWWQMICCIVIIILYGNAYDCLDNWTMCPASQKMDFTAGDNCSTMLDTGMTHRFIYIWSIVALVPTAVMFLIFCQRIHLIRHRYMYILPWNTIKSGFDDIAAILFLIGFALMIWLCVECYSDQQKQMYRIAAAICAMCGVNGVMYMMSGCHADTYL